MTLPDLLFKAAPPLPALLHSPGLPAEAHASRVEWGAPGRGSQTDKHLRPHSQNRLFLTQDSLFIKLLKIYLDVIYLHCKGAAHGLSWTKHSIPQIKNKHSPPLPSSRAAMVTSRAQAWLAWHGTYVERELPLFFSS